MNAASPAPPAPAPPQTHALRDFQDWLSPMLVKELRQGTRAALFIWPLIVMNLALTVIVWLMALSPEERGLTSLFWWVIVLAVCGLLPLRASNALNDELRGGTIDTLVLTRLTGWRIALGKWVAVAAQQVLTVVTVMPYLLVRYFTGGVDVGQELLWLMAFLLAGVVAAGILAGFSWLPHFLLRAGLMIGVLFIGGSAVAVFIERGVRDPDFWSGMWASWGWTGFAAIATAVAHTVFFALDSAAGRAGSRVENRSALRRLTAVAALCVYGLVIWRNSGVGSEPAAVFSMVFAVGTAILTVTQAMAETPVPLAPVARPFVRRGKAGRLAGRFLYPGWPSGIWFSFLICAAFFAVFFAVFLSYLRSGYGGGSPYSGFWQRNNLLAVVTMLGIIGTLAVPPVLYHLLFRRWLPWNAGVFVLLLVTAMAAHLVIATSADGLDRAAVLYPGMILPTMGSTALYTLAEDAGRDMLQIRPEAFLNLPSAAVLMITFFVTAAWWVVALALGLKGMREMLDAENEAAEGLPAR